MKDIVSFMFGLLAGAFVGCTVVSLYTPKTGDEIRENIRNSFDEIKLDYELGRQKKKEEMEEELKRRWGEE